MRVLVTGHQGYLGTVMVPILQAAGHDVTGLDSGFFADCVLGPAPQDPPGIQVDLRDVTLRATERIRSGHPSRRIVQRPARRVGAADHLRHQPPRLGPVGAAGERGRRSEVPVRLHLLGVRGSGRGSGHRECSVTTADPVRGEQGPRGGRRRRDRGRVLLAGVPAQRHRVRVLAASARGHRAEQSGRSRCPHRRRSSALRRHAVASAGARPRHRSRFSRALEAPIDKVHCAAYNVGTESNNLTVAEIAQSVVDVVPGAKLLITGETGSDPRSYRVDFSAFRHALGFEAAWSIPDGAAELYKEYISAGLTA